MNTCLQSTSERYSSENKQQLKKYVMKWNKCKWVTNSSKLNSHSSDPNARIDTAQRTRENASKPCKDPKGPALFCFHKCACGFWCPSHCASPRGWHVPQLFQPIAHAVFKNTRHVNRAETANTVNAILPRQHYKCRSAMDCLVDA